MTTSKTVLSCLNKDCPERKSVCCGALPKPCQSSIRGEYFVCGDCEKEFRGGKCNVMERDKTIEEWESCDWKKEFDETFYPFGKSMDKYVDGSIRLLTNEERCKKFIETLLIKILAKCESEGTARGCRHVIKQYLLHEK